MNYADKMNEMFKFAIGDLVGPMVHSGVRKRTKGDKKPPVTFGGEIYQVVERLAQQCNGGVQLHYLVRPHMMDWGKFRVGTELLRISEIELEALPEELEEPEHL